MEQPGGGVYTVYWTDDLRAPIFWRVAEVNIPSGCTNTTWSEGDCSQMLMRSGSSSGGEVSKLSEKEKGDRLEKARGLAEEGFKFLTAALDEAIALNAKNHSALSTEERLELIRKRAAEAKDSSASEGAALRSLWAGGASGGMKFYRVARTGVSGFVDGFGAEPGPRPAGLTNVISVSASPRFAGVHSLALKADGTVVAWGANSLGNATCRRISPRSWPSRRAGGTAWPCSAMGRW